MAMNPLVSILTPVYNGEPFLRECIESVLNQRYDNFEYIIINNCSKDNTLSIAKEYAGKDNRIRVHDNAEFVGVIANHNIAFGLIAPDAKYCKVVSADDFIFPDCISKLVAAAEANPSAAFVGSYQISGSRVLWQGFPYPKALFSGRELCREMLLRADPSFGFGAPTSLLYRADLLRIDQSFYPNASPHADTSALFKHLANNDFAFVYETLSFERTHEQTQSSASKKLNRYSSAYLSDLQEYGHHYLNEVELKTAIRNSLDQYHAYLASHMMRFREAEFRNYHAARLKELGHPLNSWIIFMAAVRKFFHEFINPGQMSKKLKHLSSS